MAIRMIAVGLCMVLSFIGSTAARTSDELHSRYGHILMAPACPTEEFVVEFAEGSTDITEAARAQFVADLVHPKSCNVEVAYLAAYNPGALNAVRELLTSEGVQSDAIHTIQLTIPVSPYPYQVEHVRVTFVYR